MRLPICLAIWCVAVSICAADISDNGYIFTSPRSLKIGSNNELQLIRFGDLNEGGSLKVKVFYSENYNGNQTLAVEKEFEIEKGKQESLFNLKVDTFTSNYVYNGKLELNGTIGDKEFGGSDKIYFSTPKNKIILIQNDKPMYQPGQEVKFRVLKLNKKLIPSGDKDDVADIYVEDPKRTRLFEFKNVHLEKGMIQREFPLSEEPVLGSWRIFVETGNETESTTFEVKRYVLPKFDVKIKFPSFVLANAEEIPVEICAKYTYGKNVVGTLNLNVSLEKYSWSRDKVPTIQEKIELDGCFNYTVNVSLIDQNDYRYRRIQVVANVIEKGTDIQMNKTEYLQRQYSPLSLNFNNDPGQEHFKAGLPYKGKLKVSNPDDTPAAGEDVEICSTVSRERVISNWFGTKKVKFCKNFTSDDDGIIKFTLPPQNIDSTSIYLSAKSISYAKKKGATGRDTALSTPETSMSLSPYYSPSGNYIQLENGVSKISCGEEKSIKVYFTSKEDAEYDFKYQIIKQGQVVQSGTNKVSFSVADDVSKKIQDPEELVEGAEIQIVPSPQSIVPGSSSSSSSSEEGDCPGARESKYVPPIGETEIKINVDADLSPSFTLLVFYVRDDRETVADSQKFKVEKCFKNKVAFEFGDEVKQPATKTSIKVTAAPNSLCGIKVVDKSITLLDSNDQLTPEKVFQLIENMDSNIYYSSNPCNEDNPQPGLYSSKSSIIRPPRPPTYSSSSYEDSLSAFQSAGYLVISDLKLFTRPCSGGGGYGGYGGSGAPESFQSVPNADRDSLMNEESFYDEDSDGLPRLKPGMAPRRRVHMKTAPPPVALASVARRPAAAGMAAADGKLSVGMGEIKSAVEVRDFFPETWLFNMEMTGPDGVFVSKEKLPHTITEWVGSAACVNPEVGLGISNTTSIKGFQAFFISYTLPVAVIRGEEFWIVVSVFSYADKALPISVSLDDPEGFEITSDSINREVCIEPDTSSNLRIRLKATALGKVNITVRAESAQNSNVCGPSEVSDSLAKDAITQPITVDAEGFPNERSRSVLFCPTDSENQKYTEPFHVFIPDDVVPDSSRAYLDVSGNVMGPAINNLDKLVALPTGCGEQNMVKFTPNYLVLDYLKDIGKLTDTIKSKAIRNLNTGYQRELTYRHQDGSFSAFGEVDNEGSMFLTAFVLRSFHEAKRYITIDNSILTKMQEWIASKQAADGHFPNVGRVIDYGLQGGIEKESNPGGVTAYTLASLYISGYENETVLTNAKDYLKNDQSKLTPYETFLYAYAEALAGDTESAKNRLDGIKPFANTTGGLEHYNNPNGTQSVNLETAAYAVLTNLLVGNGAPGALPIVRFMTENLNPRGGFFSTQDTCVGLDALSKFAGLVYKDPVDILVKVSGDYEESYEITEDNKLLVQRKKVPKVPSDFVLEATGSGCGLAQATLRYNTLNPRPNDIFHVGVTHDCVTSDCKRREMNIAVSYIPKGQAAGMSVVEVKMISGYVPVKESLEKVKNDKTNNILRFDVEDNKAIFYLDRVTNEGTQFTIQVEQVVEVENVQPSTVKVYDYYSPERTQDADYTFGNPSNESKETTEP